MNYEDRRLIFMKKNTLIHIGLGITAALITLRINKVIKEVAKNNIAEAEFEEVIDDTRN